MHVLAALGSVMRPQMQHLIRCAFSKDASTAIPPLAPDPPALVCMLWVSSSIASSNSLFRARASAYSGGSYNTLSLFAWFSTCM